MASCRCGEHPSACGTPATQEDLLCDACRPGQCVAVTVNGEAELHVSQETGREWAAELAAAGLVLAAGDEEQDEEAAWQKTRTAPRS